MNTMTYDINQSVKPSQLIGVFGPGAIYDNLRDSVLILGTDYWDENRFEPITDPYLLSHVKKSSKYFANLKAFVSISSSTDESSVPVTSFPTWGACPECGMLQKRHGRGGRHEFECKSKECHNDSNKNNSRPPDTIPVRFVAACENGHLDDFPFYEWAHRGNYSNCSKADALLYMEDRRSVSSSLDSKYIVCKNCNSENDMGMALTKTGIEHTTRKKCNGINPCLKFRKHANCDLSQVGMLKGASNLFFPYNRSAITVPPFSDELSHEILKKWDDITKISQKDEDFFKKYLETVFNVKTDKNPNGKYTVNDIIEKYKIHRTARTKKDLPDIAEMEFKELNSGHPISEKEFETEYVDVPDRFKNDIDKVVLVKKLRQIITITGFTRFNPVDPTEEDIKIAAISSDPPEWLPAAENRGEGIFLSLNQSEIRKWEQDPRIISRVREIRGHNNSQIDARYMLLHSLSHSIIKSISDLAGYSTSNIHERIYSSSAMAGILIFTSSSSSDGSLGGLVEQGKTDNFYQVIQKAITKSKICSSDPLCAFSKPAKKKTHHGAACHACLFLPETSCEKMNVFLDRSVIHSTLDKGTKGFFMREDSE